MPEDKTSFHETVMILIAAGFMIYIFLKILFF
jgi:hypothetical protein